MPTARIVVSALTASMTLPIAGCGGKDALPTAPTPPVVATIANVYVLPDAVALGPFAFGDEPLVIYKGEQMRWTNLDRMNHAIVADTAGATDFDRTNELPPTGQQSFVMTRLGTTKIHCTIHPEMTGSIIVRER